MAKTEKLQALKVSTEGRVVIPADFRRELGVGPGDDLIAWLEGDRLVLRTRRSMEEELWAMFEDVEGSLADELIRERREEARRELAD